MIFADAGELIKRCAMREKGAWDAFVERYSRLIFWAIKQRLANSGSHFTDEHAREVYQEVFLNIWEQNRLQEIKHPRALSTWLVIVAGRAAIDYMRRQSRDAGRRERLTEEIVYNGPSPAQEAERGELRAFIDRAASVLSPREKIVWELHLLHKKTTFEVARIMNLSPNTVGGTIRRLKRKLRAELKVARPVRN